MLEIGGSEEVNRASMVVGRRIADLLQHCLLGSFWCGWLL
jgi:hypothetical protein